MKLEKNIRIQKKVLKRNFKKELLLINIVGSVILISTILFAVSSNFENHTKKEYISSIETQFEMMENEILGAYKRVEQDIDMFVNDLRVQELDGNTRTYENEEEQFIIDPRENTPQEANVFEMLDNYAKTHPEVMYAYVATAEGGYIGWPVHDFPPHYDPTVQAWYLDTLAGEGALVQSAPYQATSGEIIITNAKAAYREDGSLIGVTGIDLQQNFLYDIVGNMSSGETGGFLIIDSQGYILVDSQDVENCFVLLEETKYQTLVSPYSGDYQYETLEGVEYLTVSNKLDISDWYILSYIETEELYGSISNFMNRIKGWSILGLLAIVIITQYIIKKIIKPILTANNHLKKIGETDLTVCIEETYINRDDEIGTIFKSLKNVHGQLSSMLLKIKNDSSIILDETATCHDSVNKLNGGLQNISAAAEELTATLEETSANCEHVLSTSKDISKEMLEMNEMATQSVESINNNKLAVKDLEEKVYEEIENSNQVLGNVRGNVDEAIASTGIIEEVEVLLDRILNIVSQTSILALNAKIEAARINTGNNLESGKGFAVIADEIGKLAITTQETAADIQEYMSQLNEVMNTLTSSSKTLLDTSSQEQERTNEVINAIITTYIQDVDVIRETLLNFSDKASQLNEEVQISTDSMEDIANASNEGAESIAVMTNNAYNIATESTSILENITSCKEAAAELEKQTKQFNM